MTVLTHRRAWRGGALCALACYTLALQGCATQHRHDGVHGVEEALAARGLAVTATAGQPIPVPEAKPLSVAEVVGIALSNSPAVQSEYVALALGADEVYAAPPWPTPVFSGEWLDPKFPGTTQRVFGLAVAVGDLITWPARRRISQQHYATLQARVADAVIAAASATAAAYYRHAAALQAHELQRRITTTATLRADLAGRFHAAGNMAERELAEYRASAAQARLAQLDSAHEVDVTRVALADTLGVSTREKWQIDRRLALPARAPGQVDGLVKLARDTRLDLDAARIELESAITEGQAIPWANWFGNIEVGYVRDRDTDQTLKRGPSLVVGLPDVGHHGAPALAEAEIEFLRLYYEIENAVALAASDVARGRERVEIYAAELLPQQGAASRGALAQYNFMLTGPFDLLEQKQHELESYRGYIEALRDYWLARVELDRALGVAPAREFDDASWFDIDTPTIGAGSEMDHSQHQMMDHSQHEGMDHSQHEGMDHSQHKGMDHSQHEGMRPADPRRPERSEQGDGQ